MGSTEAQNSINWGLTEAGQKRLAELRQQTIAAACTPMADWLDNQWPRRYTGADAAEIVEFAAQLLRYPVNVGFPEKNDGADLKKVQKIFDEEIQQAENDIETSAFIKWLEDLRDRVLEQVSQKSDEPESRATDEAHPPGWRSHAHYSIAVDFDGVIHSYLSPWEGAHIIPDPPVAGAFNWLEKMARKFHVIIFSTRCLTPEGCAAVREYLRKPHQSQYRPAKQDMVSLEVIEAAVVDIPCRGLGNLVDGFECTATKEAALIYLDDRAVRFDGTNFPTVDEIHRKLIPWNKRQMGDHVGRI